jgi:carboxylesterase
MNEKSKIGVLMLHGFTSTPDQFKELGAFFTSKGFLVSAPLIAGHGTKPENLAKTSPKDWQMSAKDAYLELKKTSDKIAIIGNSFGSNLGFWLCKEFNNEPIAMVSLGAPIFLRWQKWILCRLYTYGFIQKYYKKPSRIYRTDYTDFDDEVAYPIMPTKSLREFFSFIKNETIKNLDKIEVPIFIGQSDSDIVVNPKSTTFIYESVASQIKKVYWLEGNAHIVMTHKKRNELFEKIYSFINEVA